MHERPLRRRGQVAPGPRPSRAAPRGRRTAAAGRRASAARCSGCQHGSLSPGRAAVIQIRNSSERRENGRPSSSGGVRCHSRPSAISRRAGGARRASRRAAPAGRHTPWPALPATSRTAPPAQARRRSATFLDQRQGALHRLAPQEAVQQAQQVRLEARDGLHRCLLLRHCRCSVSFARAWRALCHRAQPRSISAVRFLTLPSFYGLYAHGAHPFHNVAVTLRVTRPTTRSVLATSRLPDYTNHNLASRHTHTETRHLSRGELA